MYGCGYRCKCFVLKLEPEQGGEVTLGVVEGRGSQGHCSAFAGSCGPSTPFCTQGSHRWGLGPRLVLLKRCMLPHGHDRNRPRQKGNFPPRRVGPLWTAPRVLHLLKFAAANPSSHIPISAEIGICYVGHAKPPKLRHEYPTGRWCELQPGEEKKLG